MHRPDDIVCRIGGQEFVLLLPGTDEAGALRVAGEVHDQVAGMAVASAGIQPSTVSVSVGLACAGDDMETDALYRRADEALYAAKANGRNRTKRAPEADKSLLGTLWVAPRRGSVTG